MNNTNTILLPSTKIEGDVTSCKVESVIQSVQKEGAFSFEQISTYQTYDVCTKEIIEVYSVPELTLFGGFLVVPVLILALLVPFIVWVTFAILNDKRKGVYGRGY